MRPRFKLNPTFLASYKQSNLTEKFFSSSYEEARERFISSARNTRATIQSYPIACSAKLKENLSIDVASVGEDHLPTVVITSGVHGVEGYLGSAIQLAHLDEIRQRQTLGVRVVYIHAINPFGFAFARRFDEENIDLNRNFLLSAESYEGAPGHYTELNDFLNPTSAPSAREFFRLKALLRVMRFGTQALKQSIAGGQYEFPQGIFFGGQGRAQSTEIICGNCDHWINKSQKVIHIDIHSGLGKFGACKLLIAEPKQSAACRWYQELFGEKLVEATEDAAGTAYRAAGPLGLWLQDYFSSRTYRFVTAEFGTYDPIRVLAAIRAENRAYYHGDPHSPEYPRAKSELLECFCPQSNKWRNRAVRTGLEIIEKSIRAMGEAGAAE